MTKKMIDLQNEYLRSIIYGTDSKSTKKRRPVAEITTDISTTNPENAKKIIQSLDDYGKTLKDAGDQAEKLAQNGVDRGSLDLENLLSELEREEYPWVRSYLYSRFDNADTEKESNQAIEKKSEDLTEIPQKTTLQPIDSSNFFAMNFAPQRTVDVSELGSDFPPNWKKPKWHENLKSFEECMYEYCYYGLWESGSSRIDKMKKMIEKARTYCKKTEDLEKARATADEWLKTARAAAETALKRKSDTPEQEKQIRRIGGPLPKHIDEKRKKEQKHSTAQKAKAKHRVIIDATPTNIKPQQLSVPQQQSSSKQAVDYPHHQNDIAFLAPAPAWTLYVDESGKEFNTGENGIIAGVLSCDQNPLPKQPKLHAADDETEEKMLAGDKVIETLLKHPNCGVLAVPVKAYRSAAEWISMVGSLVDLVMRMLPLNESTTTLKVVVENKGMYERGNDFAYIRDACNFKLMQTYPERAKLINLSIEVMTKNDARNAYPDIVANTCFTRESKMGGQRYRASGWGNSCFLNYSAEKLSGLLDYFYKSSQLPESEWANLVGSEVGRGNNLFAALLNLLGKEAQQNINLWKKYLDHTANYLSAGGLNLYRLHNQLDWLKRHQPADEQLPPRVKLLWLTSKLAEANHLGEITQHPESDKIFMELIRDLYEEDAPLTCFATLHLAVQMTNAFQFERAKELVLKYSNIGALLNPEPPFTRFVKDAVRKLIGDDRSHYLPAAIPGLRFYGQLLSSCGQHEAFLGNQKNAAIYFEEAINCFQRLSENREDDIDKTLAYAATSAMDLDPAGDNAYQLITRYLQVESLTEASGIFAENKDDVHKYHHHIFLRYLVHSDRTECAEAIKVYLAEKESWSVGGGHPWEMIEFYRGILTGSMDEKLKLFHHAYKMALEGGPTLHIIACVMLGSIAYYDQSVLADLSALIEKTVEELPALGADRISCLRAQCKKPIEPLTFAKAILPFNFR